MSDSDRNFPMGARERIEVPPPRLRVPSIDWRTISDDEIEAALAERERRKQEALAQASPVPWKAKTFMVVDANGKGVAHCGGYNIAEINIANARVLACGPDGVELARWCLDEDFLNWLPDATRTSTRVLAKELLEKAGIV